MEEKQKSRRVSEGKCSICGVIFSKMAIKKHLDKCVAEKEAKSANRTKTKIFQLLVEGRYAPIYWMYIEASANTMLCDLDDLLKEEWLECCGHMSAFTIGKRVFSIAPSSEWRKEEGMDIALGKILSPGIEFYHEYDFGTTTELTLKVISEREGVIGKRPVILASNEPPFIPCNFCSENATQVCVVCVEEKNGWFCDKCCGKHDCGEGEEMFLPVVNSPRVGMCGYTGKEE